jgi:serine phosphatase RsbU (regulator of sigma subunit)
MPGKLYAVPTCKGGGGKIEIMPGVRVGRVYFAIAAFVLFASCNVLTSLSPFLEAYRIRFQVAIPLLSGYLAGPLAGFLVGFLGNMAGDAISGVGMLRFAASFSASYGIYGFLMGILGRRRPRFDAPEDLGDLYSTMLIYVFAGMLYAALVEWLVFGIDLWVEFENIVISGIVSNYLSSAALVPWFLWAAGRIRRTMAQRYTLFVYYFSFVLATGCVAFVLSMLSLRFNLTLPNLHTNLFIYDILIIPTITAVVVGSLVSVRMTRKIAKPLSEMGREIRRISEEGFTSKLKVYFDEDLRDLSEAFNGMTDRLAVYSDEIRQIAGREEQVLTELRVASKIQRMLLPDEGVKTEAGCEIYGCMVPMKEIGGDFFNYFPLDGGRLFFVVADVAGHGIPAALIMMVTNAVLESLVLAESDIERVFAMLNERLCKNNSENYFVTAFAGIFDSASRTLKYVNAGHPAPYVKPASGPARALPCGGNVALGAIEGQGYASGEIAMREGDILCVYTDGVTEAMNGDFEMYGWNRLLQTIDGVSVPCPKTLAKRIFSDLSLFTGNSAPSDDVTVLCVEF